MKACLLFWITLAEIDDLETKIIQWVQDYEECVLTPFTNYNLAF